MAKSKESGTSDEFLKSMKTVDEMEPTKDKNLETKPQTNHPESNRYRESKDPTTTRHTGSELTQPVFKKNANQLHVKCFNLLTKLMAGDMINNMCTWALDDVDEMIAELKKAITE